MIYLGTPGYFRLSVNQFWDEEGIALSGNQGNYETSITVFVFSLRTRQSMDQFVLNLTSKQEFSYENPTCARSQGLRTSEVRYTADVQFDPSRYTDAGGYYIVWERCCRNAAVNNIVDPGKVGMVFYLEFPAMRTNGQNIINSSPDFVLPNGKYACVNKPFQLLFKANDADGDELRYRLVTPLVGYTSTAQSAMGSPQSRTSYPSATWSPGYSDKLMISGPDPLQIDSRTGELTLTAGQEGLFVFAVEVVELRRGVVIGLARREFQLMVKDCSPITPPPPVVTSLSKPVNEVSFCANSGVRLETQSDPKWRLQWQKDNVNIAGATGPTLEVKEPGLYTVVKSLSDVCAKDTASQEVRATQLPGSTVKITPAGSTTFCEGSAVSLQTNANKGTLNWFYNGKDLKQPNQTAITANLTGSYRVEYVESTNACPGRDSLTVTVHPLPKALIKASPRAVICDTISVQLSADNQPGWRYTWIYNGTPWQLTNQNSVSINQAGRYQLSVTDGNGCQATSPPLTITKAPLPNIRFDSLAPVCNTQQPVTLGAQPMGGQYSGKGINGNLFNPTTAGPGQHTITYTYTDENGCQNTQSRLVQVQEEIGLFMPKEMVLLRGESDPMPVTIKAPIVQASWSPPNGLDDPSVLRPNIRADESQRYSVNVQTALGCRVDASIFVRVIERMYIPTAFTPNSDGNNDTWEIRGAGNFPECEVYIFNRWGSVIYYSKGYSQPWDGTYKGDRVEPGSYTFRIETHLNSIRYLGTITVLY